MRNFSLLILFLAIGFAGFSQKASQKSLMNVNVRTAQVFKSHSQPYALKALKAVGDTIFYNDVSVAGDFSIYNLSGNTSDWVWSTTGPTGQYSAPMGIINSTTASNGFMLFDSDNYGDFPHDGIFEYIGTVDCSAYSNVSFTAQQMIRNYSAGAQCIVEISTDGTSWTQYFVNTGVASGSISEDPISVNISATAANQATVYFRVRYIGQWEYAWMIDDIAIVEGADYELVGQGWVPSFYGAGWYSMMPKSNHTALTYFEVPIFNNGAQQLTGLNMDVVITDEAAVEVYNQNTTTTVSGLTTIASAASDTLYNDVPFDPDTTAVHTYTVNMSIGEAETDENPANNALANPYSFEITDMALARATEINRWLSIAYYTGTVSGDIFGTVVYIPNPDTVASMDVFLRADAAALAGGASVQATLYYQDPATGDWIEVISSALYDISVADTISTGHWVNLPYVQDGFSEVIPGGGWYLVALKTFLDPATEVVDFGADFLFPHDWQNSVNLSVNGTYYYTSSGVPDFILNMDHWVGVNTVNHQDNISVYPNPAHTAIHVDHVTGATIEVYNLMGQNVMTVNDANAFNTLNVETLSAGTYVVKVINDSQVHTTKINIVK